MQEGFVILVGRAAERKLAAGRVHRDHVDGLFAVCPELLARFDKAFPGGEIIFGDAVLVENVLAIGKANRFVILGHSQQLAVASGEFEGNRLEFIGIGGHALGEVSHAFGKVTDVIHVEVAEIRHADAGIERVEDIGVGIQIAEFLSFNLKPRIFGFEIVLGGFVVVNRAVVAPDEDVPGHSRGIGAGSGTSCRKDGFFSQDM